MSQAVKTKNLSQLKIALAHDYLREFGGAERVLEALHQLFPQAPVYVAFTDPRALGADWSRFAGWDLRTTRIERLPFYRQLFSPYRIFAAKAFADLDLSAYDLVISSSNAYFAKAVRVPRGKQLCYCHTPPRVLYGYSAKSNWRQNPLTRLAGNLLNHFVRLDDWRTAQQVDQFIANSTETQRRIKKFYKRESVVIFPPVAMVDQANQYFAQLTQAQKADFSKQKKQGYYLYVNRLALAKHPELAVQAAKDLDLPLKVVGSGGMLHDLQQGAGPRTEFLGAVSDRQLAELYRGAKALLYPVEDEDFGMVPIEAMAWGTPVIAHYSGGPKETVVAGKTGIFFQELTVTALKSAIQQLPKQNFSWQTIQQSSGAYAPAQFQQKLLRLIKKLVAQ